MAESAEEKVKLERKRRSQKSAFKTLEDALKRESMTWIIPPFLECWRENYLVMTV